MKCSERLVGFKRETFQATSLRVTAARSRVETGQINQGRYIKKYRMLRMRNGIEQEIKTQKFG